MDYLAWLVLMFTAVQFLVTLINLLYPQPFPPGGCGFNGLVSVLIPARNEEGNIAGIISDLREQMYSRIEIIVFNDQSTDRTAERVEQLARQDERIRLIHSAGLPDGWLGKNYACHGAAQSASGNYFLFLDADVRLRTDAISGAVSLAEKHRLDLLSVFPMQVMGMAGEKSTVPLMNYILLSLLPLILVRLTKFQSLAAANGQFILFRADRYRELLPHQKVKNKMAEDIEIARYYKRTHGRIACTTGVEAVSCRMYHGFNQAVSGFAKNVISFFGNSTAAAILFWFLTTFGFLFVATAFGVPVLVMYLVLVVLIRIMVSYISRQSISDNLLYLIPQQIALGIILYEAIKNRIKKQQVWKNRNITL